MNMDYGLHMHSTHPQALQGETTSQGYNPMHLRIDGFSEYV